MVEELAPDGFSNIDDVLPYEQRKAIVRGYASTAGFSREQVNRPAKDGLIAKRRLLKIARQLHAGGGREVDLVTRGQCDHLFRLLFFHRMDRQRTVRRVCGLAKPRKSISLSDRTC